MNLEQQVCSLDLAKRLKELGVKQESYAYWSNGKVWPYPMMTELDFNPGCYAAFTVAELGEMLPRTVVHGSTLIYKQHTFISSEGWRCEYWSGVLGLNNSQWRLGADCYADTEADARAKMLIYLIENKLITV